MITIKTFVFNAFQENTYLLYDETKECIIIDAGCYIENERNEISSFISDNNLTPKFLLNTHCHIDHILGNNFLAEKYNLKLRAHKDDSVLLANAVSYGSVYGFEIAEPVKIENEVDEQSEIKFGNSSLKPLYVPGHSPGSLAYYSAEDNFVIVGDVLFAGSIGRTDLPGGDYDTLINSINSKLLPLGDNVKVYTGHGPYTTIGAEIHSNPFLK